MNESVDSVCCPPVGCSFSRSVGRSVSQSDISVHSFSRLVSEPVRQLASKLASLYLPVMKAGR